MNSFTGKSVLVTGGTSGIGKSTALAFAKHGANVVLTGRREKEGLATVAEIKEAGGTAAFVQADVAKDAEVKKVIDFVVQTYGRLDIAFNNAGIEQMAPVSEVTEEQYRHLFDINVWGVLNSMKHEAEAMAKTGGGAIVNTSSIGGHVGFAGMSIYVASKHAVEGLTKCAAQEFAAQRIRVNAVAPGPIATAMMDRLLEKRGQDSGSMNAQIPAGRLGSSEEIAAAVLYLCSDDAKFTTGTSLVVDGGYISK